EVDSQIGWMDASAFRVAYSESNALQRLVVASLSERCFHFVRDIHDLCFRSVTSRLSEKLLEMAGHEGIVEASHANLAAAIGSSREVVSRQLKAFANDGLLEMKRGAITLIDFESLLALSSTES
ncbi:MAG: helix-turn-helix domain-containing protein, partial [Gammaproteobacteria bacterium]